MSYAAQCRHWPGQPRCQICGMGYQWCSGSRYCQAKVHVHGCFADDVSADCDDRDQHDYWWKQEPSHV